MPAPGPKVLGIDLSDDSIAVARAHAAPDPSLAGRLSYLAAPAEALAASEAGAFDAVVASEVIEHVRAPGAFLATLAALTKPRGAVVISTLNRTPASYALAIVGAEYVTRVVPPGTHDWGRFVTPQELAMMGADAGLGLHQIAGMVLDPLRRGGPRFALRDDLSVNYIACLRRRG